MSKSSSAERLSDLLAENRHLTLSGVPDGLEGRVLADLVRLRRLPVTFVARDARHLEMAKQSLRFFAPDIRRLTFPAWDCLPYDRVSPNADVVARRMATLKALVDAGPQAPLILLTTANAIIQRVPPHEWVARHVWSAGAGDVTPMEGLVARLAADGFERVPTVRAVGEYAVRGGIVDLFAPGDTGAIRCDFFGDTLETIRPFDPENQRTTGQVARLDLLPASEIILDDEVVARFRQNYREAFGAVTSDDPLYEAISAGRRFAGMEHWLAFFHERLETVLDYAGDTLVAVDHLAADTLKDRWEQIGDHYEARKENADQKLAGAAPYKPAAPDSLYLTLEEWQAKVDDHASARLTPFASPDESGSVHDVEGRAGRTFAAERTAGDVNVFDALVAHVADRRKAGKRIVLATWSVGARDRLIQVLSDHGMERLQPVETWAETEALAKGITGMAVMPLETGFETPDSVFIGDQDVLGDRLVRPARKRKRAADALTEAASLSEGDLVVHVDHGIGRFDGLVTIEAAGAPHDCLQLVYAGGDKLFLPVENIDLLTRYGAEGSETALDKLGGVAWQNRKARLKKRIREIADALIKTAAARLLRQGEKLVVPEGLYGEFAARFPYEETDDQDAAIEAAISDLGSGRPMDRLVCGDVGFGKTEVALRAAFVAAMSGKQVAVIVPTTLLARQHYKTFVDRFRGLPLQVGGLSRLVGTAEKARVRAGLADGTIDIVVGTHALLAKSVNFRDLGLVIVDEEQHFGVKHKERLKELRSAVHVLTLTATPIPRTLQLALTGVRDLSIIATPPVDRLAVRTFISPFDPLIVREALLRERLRGGQSFYVVPRISDLAEVKEFLDQNLPEARVAVAHGQMAASELDQVMNAFYDGQYDVLLSTTIVESGLDIPTANTLIIHRADMFGLAQLYQLRGRIGRSKNRAYAYFTVPAKKTMTSTAERRLKVLQSLDSLGAGFQLASHDLDIRGAGNLLGEEQSGHIKEVGFELYQQMLEEAVAGLKAGDEELAEGKWSPQITIGMAVMIPETYVPDLTLRMSLYRRLADLEDAGDIDAFGAELIDRFGPMPDEVDHLLKVVYVKSLCRRANVEKVDAGPKGVVIALRNNEFANPGGLVRYIGEQGSMAKIRPDQRIVLSRDWPRPEDRLKGTASLLTRLAKIAEEGAQKAA
ncbi:transcription-repair coupling factor (superfamily II helicase) [Rhodopseudomonas julia]|uniref:Transcription-repair-coupling factor n=1 Tax=Rhodopseudomonas julia TaxID=200617 RepID=A0ABU0C9E3_9BRAD|nr:transcription-repair coupling factor [Rhodopseudomonas julia]MDQ0327109.1 transcription-repair coupling factor (superfamily II helicase) [Rhodopseudomonas julia]